MVRSQLARAFRVWAEASVLTFSELSDQRADIVVSFLNGSHGDGYPFDGEGSVLAHAFFPGEGIGGDAHFDAEETWLPQHPKEEEEGVNLFAVAAHEIGHSLGLSHSSTPGSLMFPYYQFLDGYFKLPDDDANGIQQLYGSKETKKWATMPTVYPTAYTRRPTLPPAASTTGRTTTPTTAASTTSSSTSRTTATATRVTTSSSVATTSSPTKSTRRRGRITSAAPTEADVIPTTRSTTRRIPFWPPTTSPEKHSTVKPDTCNSSIDAISVIRREVFLFKDKYFWRLDINKKLKKNYPVPINRFWYNLPHNIERVDALYERPIDKKIVFFTGKLYWLFGANQLMPGYPRPITDLGFSPYVDRIDAAFVWGHNGKTYFFSGRQYWKFDEAEGTVELDYPRDVSVWRGVPHNIDAAFQWTDGNTYFFKGKKYWKFNDVKMKAQSVPGDLSRFWFGCEVKNDKIFTATTLATSTPGKEILEAPPKSSAIPSSCSMAILLLCILCHLISHAFIFASTARATDKSVCRDCLHNFHSQTFRSTDCSR